MCNSELNDWRKKKIHVFAYSVIIRTEKLVKGQIIFQRTNELSFDKYTHLLNDKFVSFGTQTVEQIRRVFGDNYWIIWLISNVYQQHMYYEELTKNTLELSSDTLLI